MSVTQHGRRIEKMAHNKNAFWGRVLDGAKALKNRFLGTADDAARSMPMSPADDAARSMPTSSAGGGAKSVPASPADGGAKSMTTPSGSANKSMSTVSRGDEVPKGMSGPGGNTAEDVGGLLGGYGQEIGIGAAGAGAGALGTEMLDGDKEAAVRERFGLSSDTNRPDHSGASENRFSRPLAQ